MAISAPTELVHDHVNTSGGTFTNTSATYVSGRLYIAFCGGSGATNRTNTSLAGVSGTWTELPAGDKNLNDGTNWNGSIFTATDATGSGSLTITYSGSWASSRFIQVFEFASGFDTSGMIVQSVNNSAAAVGTLTVDLADSSASANMRVACIAHRIQEALTAGNSGTKVGERQVAAPGSVKALWYIDAVTTNDPNFTWADSTRGALMCAFELKATAGGASQALAGTAAITIGQTSDVTVAHALAATSAVAIGQTSALAVTHPLAGTSAVTFGQTSDLTTPRDLAGTAAVTFTQTADVTVAHSLAGTAAVAFAQTAALVVDHTLAATSAVAFGQTSALSVGAGVREFITPLRSVAVLDGSRTSEGVLTGARGSVAVRGGQRTSEGVLTGTRTSQAVLSGRRTSEREN